MPNIVDGEVTSVAFCWQLERSDGAGIGLTSHDRLLSKEGIEHAPSPGIVPATVTRGLGLDPQSSEIGAALTSDTLSETDLMLGRWDDARVRLFAMEWLDDGAEPLELIAGELGEVSIDGGGFSAELRGAAAKLSDPVCPSTSPQCRAQFGDPRCGVDLAARTIRAAVIASDNGELTLDQAIRDDFLLGRLRFLSGANCGRSTVVIGVHGNFVKLRDLPRVEVLSGAIVELREGCDKRLQTCTERFANAANFRGEPHLPGADLLTRYPGA
jgi:uncharacterized phage protein (TIGR02218 family)